MTKPPLVPKLKNGAVIKIVGLGGVGSIVSRYLSIFCAAQNIPCQMVLIDGDQYEPKNSARMLFSEYGNKADVVRRELLPYFQDTMMALIAIPMYVKPEDVGELIIEGDIVILCVDNHQTRKLINERCKALSNVVLVNGGNHGVGEDSSGRVQRGTYGNVQIYIRNDNVDVSYDICKLHPEIANPKDKLPTDISCTEALLSTPQIIFANLAVASAICNAVYLYLCDQLGYQECCFDIAEAKMVPMLPMNKPGET